MFLESPLFVRLLQTAFHLLPISIIHNLLLRTVSAINNTTTYEE